MPRVLEDVFCRDDFHEPSQMEMRDPVGDPFSLLHGMGDVDAMILFGLLHQN